MNNKLVIVSGPTATGKTDLSMMLAKIARDEEGLSPVIVNFDSLCFFKEIEIGTAKPTIAEREDIDHKLFDICSIATDFNASKYVTEAEDMIKDLMSKDKLVFLVGGSAFYLRALIKGMYDSIEIPDELKNSTMDRYDKDGIGFIITYLEKNDPVSLQNLHENDHYRLIRAYYHHVLTNEKFSDEKKKMDLKDPYDLSQDAKHNWDIHHIYLNIPKEDHYSIIERRAEKMLENGLLEEVEALLKTGFTGNEKPLQSIGYKEVLEYLKSQDQDKPQTKEDLIENIFISTRQLAKSQRTFFKKIHPKLDYNPLINNDEIKQGFLDFLRKN